MLEAAVDEWLARLTLIQADPGCILLEQLLLSQNRSGSEVTQVISPIHCH